MRSTSRFTRVPLARPYEFPVDGQIYGVRYEPGGCTTQSIVMRSKSGTLRMVEGFHRLTKLNEYSAIDFTGDSNAAYPLP